MSIHFPLSLYMCIYIERYIHIDVHIIRVCVYIYIHIHTYMYHLHAAAPRRGVAADEPVGLWHSYPCPCPRQFV